MLPALRNALHSFTRRADIIIRQLSYTLNGEQGDLLNLCQQIKPLSEERKQQALATVADAMSTINLGVVDPNVLRLFAGRQRRRVNSTSEAHVPMDKASRRELFIQQSLQKAFVVNNQQVAQFIVAALKNGHRIHSQQLPVQNARDLLMAAHVIEVGAAGRQSSEFRFRVEATGQRVKTDYYQMTDDFIIELVELSAEPRAELPLEQSLEQPSELSTKSSPESSSTLIREIQNAD